MSCGGDDVTAVAMRQFGEDNTSQVTARMLFQSGDGGI